MLFTRLTAFSMQAFRFIKLSLLSILCVFYFIILDARISQVSANQNAAFQAWVKTFWPVARKHGIKRKTFVRAFQNVTFDPEIIRLAERQPEFVTPTMEYIERRVNDKRIATGYEMLKTHKALLDKIEKKYGVSRFVVVAIWGLESNYGSHMGRHNIIRALATLAYKGKRRRFGRRQLLAALKILQRGDISPNNMLGSWAGAMGHTQFIPTTYQAYAVDFNRDGKRDVWSNIGDALASTARYLKVSKWRSGHTWGYRVKFTKTLSTGLLTSKRWRPLKMWRSKGVVRLNGKRFPRLNDKAKLYLPAGADGPAYLIVPNFRSILRYNNSYAYALSVGLLADKLRERKRFAQDVNDGHSYDLTKTQKKELQNLLAKRGYDIGEIDGIIGDKTSKAVLFYQTLKGLPADGVPSKQLIQVLREDTAKTVR